MRSRSRSSRSRGGGADTMRRRDRAAGGAAGSSRSRFFDVFRTRGTSGPFASTELDSQGEVVQIAGRQAYRQDREGGV